MGTKILLCTTCGATLDVDLDEDPTGDSARPICGACARSRDFLALDVADGSLDDTLSSIVDLDP